MERERIVITGMGVVSPIGIGTDNFWRNLIAGESGIGPITGFDPGELPVRVAAEVRDFLPEAHMPRKLARESARFAQFSYIAASEALAQSGINPRQENRRVGIVMGTAMSGISEIAAVQAQITTTGRNRVSPRFVPKVLGNTAASLIAIDKGIQGPCYTVSTACSSGADAIHISEMLLQSGQADVMVAVGGESILCPLVTASLSVARALTRNPDPATACRPFDADRDGFVMGEGGGALILETDRHARARGAEILGVLLGSANNTDGYHVTSPAPDGRGAIASMKDALMDAGMTPADIGYINAHGTSTSMGDSIEAAAIRSVFGENPPPVSSTKGATGHMMGAGGITEVITCLMAVREGILPPTLGCVHLAEDCPLDVITRAFRKSEISVAMSNAFGFGGQNSTVIVGRYL